MKIDTVSWFLRTIAPVWAPEDEGAGGGGEKTGGETGNETPGEEGGTHTDGTVLGGADDASASEGGEDDGAGKKDGEGDGKDGKDGEESEDGSKDGADEVPEDGSYEFELPDGVELDDEAKELWSNQFKELGLTRGQAAKLVEAQTQQVIAEQKAYAGKVEEQQKTHLETAKADEEIGGDKWEESTRLANLALKSLGGDALKNLILTTGNGNNPEVIRELRRVGMMLGDDKFEAGATHEAPVATEKSWYGATTPDTKRG